MSQFLPSELHRLVLGFLQLEAGCPDAASRFVEESPALAEVAHMRRRGNGQFPDNAFKVAGKSLVDMLDEKEE